MASFPMLQIILFIFTINTFVDSTSHIYSNTFILCISSKSCIINCMNNTHCINKSIICPSNHNCNINCHTPYSCQNTTILAINSSSLTLNALSSMSTSNSNIHCPSSEHSTCHIYGNTNTNQWNDMNIHIYTSTNHKLICDNPSNACSNDKSISLIHHHHNLKSKCKLSNINYKCIDTYNRKLLTVSTVSPNHTTNTKSSNNNSPFGIHLTPTEISYVLFAAILLVILLICALISLTYYICKQKRKRNKRDVARVNTMNTSSADIRVRYLVLAYQDGKKIKIPFDISTLDRLNNTNNNNEMTDIINRNYLSDLNDSHNKIISAVLLNDNDENDIENTENTIIASLDNISNHSRIEIIMEDKQRFLNVNNDNDNNNKCQQRIIQNSMSSNMDLFGLKKYKQRKDSDINTVTIESKDNELTQSNNTQSTITTSENSKENSHSDEIEMQIDSNKKKGHHQSSSHPQILPPNFKITDFDDKNINKNRPKTAHPMSPKHEHQNPFKPIKKHSKLLSKNDTNSTQLSSYNDSETPSKHYLNNEDIPSMQISASAPNININGGGTHIHPQPQPSRVILPSQTIDLSKTMSPSKKGRRSPNPLPKPIPNINIKKHNNYLQIKYHHGHGHKNRDREPLDMKYSKSISPNAAHRHHKNININKHNNNNAIQHQMVMQLHHQKHQRTLHGNKYSHGRNNGNGHKYNPVMPMQYKKRGKKKKNKHRHMSEPSNIMQSSSPKYHKKHVFDTNGNESEHDEHEMVLMPITFMQGEELSRSSNSRLRSKSHPSKPVKDGEGNEWMDNAEYIGFVMSHDYNSNNNNEISKTNNKKKKKKHKKKKRKSSTPTAKIKKTNIIRHRQQSGSDKLRKRSNKNPFKNDKTNTKLMPPIKAKHRNNNNTNKYYKNNKYYYKYSNYTSDKNKKQSNKYANKRNKLTNMNSANSNLTNNTLYTATTNNSNSETPIPNEINHNHEHTHTKTISMTPINIELINKSINNEILNINNKTTTISSAMVPPPPSPQLNKKYGNLSQSPTPSFKLNTHTHSNNKDDRLSNNSTVTATYDGGVHITGTYESKDNNILAPKYDSDSTLSQDTANSGTNKLNTRTPRTEITSNNGSNITETVTYINLKYSDNESNDHNNNNHSQKQMFKIRVDNVINEDINISETNSNTPTTTTDTDTNNEGSPHNNIINNNHTKTSSHSTSNDGLKTQTHTQITALTHTHTNTQHTNKQLPPPMHNNNNNNNINTQGKKHYIVGSMDSDKMFIPPVPMTNVHDEYKDIPNQNPYSHRQLRPLPDSASIGTISPDWRKKHGNQNNNNNNNPPIPFANKYATSTNSTNEEYSVYSNNDEEKSFKPKKSNISDSTHTQPPTFHNHSIHSKQTTSTHPPTFPSITITHQSQNTNRNSNNYNEDFNKEYYFHHQLEETIKSLTNKSDNETDDENFIQIDNDKLWQIRNDINHNKKHYVE